MPGGAGPSLPPTARGDAPLRGHRGLPRCWTAASTPSLGSGERRARRDPGEPRGPLPAAAPVEADELPALLGARGEASPGATGNDPRGGGTGCAHRAPGQTPGDPTGAGRGRRGLARPQRAAPSRPAASRRRAAPTAPQQLTPSGAARPEAPRCRGPARGAAGNGDREPRSAAIARRPSPRGTGAPPPAFTHRLAGLPASQSPPRLARTSASPLGVAPAVSSAFALTGCGRLFPAPRGETAGAHWLAAARRRRGPEAAAFPSSGRRHGAAARRAGGVRAAVRAGRAAARQPAAAAGRLPRPPPQRHRARGARPGPARRLLGLHRPAGAARPLHLPPRGVRGVRGAGGPRRERHGAAGAGPRLREVRRTGLRRGGAHAGAVPGAGRHRVRRAAELPAGQPALRQVHWTLLHNHSALLVFPGMLWSGSILPGPHRDRRGEAADSGRPGHLVVCGPDSPHHRRADAQRRQQLVHRVLRGAQPTRRRPSASAGPGPGSCACPAASEQTPALHKHGFTEL